MPVPTYDKFIEPILRHLAAHPEGVAARDVHEAYPYLEKGDVQAALTYAA
jgi:uncharacterized protein (DUF433 family)